VSVTEVDRLAAIPMPYYARKILRLSNSTMVDGPDPEAAWRWHG